MRHNVFGKQLNRDTGQRQALIKGLAGAIIRSEAIETTEAKAEAARGLIEKLVTLAKRASINDVRQIESILLNRELVNKLVQDIAPRYRTRPGGYLRLIKLGSRTGDNAPMVRMEFVTGSDLQPSLSTSPKAAAPKEKAKSAKVAAKKPASSVAKTAPSSKKTKTSKK